MANGTHDVVVFERDGQFRAKVVNYIGSLANHNAVIEIESAETESLGEALVDLGERLIAEGL